MSTLRFKGAVKKGIKKFSKELVLPGKAQLTKPIKDWPAAIHQGTMNVRVAGGFPSEFIKYFGQQNVALLDSRRFAPEAELPCTDIAGNTLPPTSNQPDRGNSQVWRATLRNTVTKEACQCWVLRRIGSGLTLDLELVAGDKLLDLLKLKVGASVEIDVEGEWVDINQTAP